MKQGQKTSDTFTPEQRRAVETRGVSVALSAGAGCGKTFVLTERFLANFDPADGLAPDELGQLVAITFTERAAREMRDRIRKKCHDRLVTAPADQVEYWAALLRGLDAARVSTIHAFCASLLRSRAVEAGLDPLFEVLEQAQSETLLSEVIEDSLRQWIADQDTSVIELAAMFDLHILGDMLRLLAHGCRPDQFARWLTIEPAEQVKRWGEFHRRTTMTAVVRQVGQSEAALTLRHVIRAHVPTNKTMLTRCQIVEQGLAALAAGSIDQKRLMSTLRDLRANAKVHGGGLAKAWPNVGIYETFKDAATELRETIDDLTPVVLFDETAAADAARVGAALLALAERVSREFTRRKQALSALDFNDLLSRARDLLTDPRFEQMREGLSSQITLLLVDEFQDTDPLQVELVEALCGTGLNDGKLFFVGDRKQSIYRFRGADPLVFRKLRERTPEHGRQALTANFRSQPEILRFVNALFWEDLGENYEALRATRPQVSPLPAVEFLWAPSPPDTKEDVEVRRRREAEWIARRLRALLDGGEPIVWDAEAAQRKQPAARAARPGDIAILMRALSDVEYYEDALRRHGIDYYLVGGHAFYAQQEIFDVLNLLRSLASPSDAVSLAGVLRSGMFSLMDETLFWLARHPEGLTGGLHAEHLPAEISPEEQQQVRFAASVLADLRGRKDRLRVCELIELALDRTGYDAIVLNEFLGERKLANLRKLVDQARSFEQGGAFGLADFIAQLAEFVVRQPDEPLAATQSEDTNVVRLMSIHQAKGLEFPIVVLPDVDRPRNNSSPPAHFDDELGPLVRMPKSREGTRSISGFELWRLREQSEDLDELHRLFYVATTRAADYLLLSSGVATLGAAKGPWTQLLARRFDLVGGTFCGDVSGGQNTLAMPADEPLPAIRVTIEEPPAVDVSSTRQRHADVATMLTELPGAPARELPAAIQPIAVDESARRQYSFSRLSGALAPERAKFDMAESEAAAAVTAELDPLELGTLVHEVLAAVEFGPASGEKVDLKKIALEKIDCAALLRLHAARRSAEHLSESVEVREMIERFLRSPRAADLAAAKQSHAEVEFMLRWPLEDASAKTAGGKRASTKKAANKSAGDAPPDNTLLGGFIDRLYQDAAGDWHVLDFKTNRVNGGVARVAAEYEMQMLVYALAAERILGVAPRGLILHFLRTGDEHVFAWDARARKRVIEMVDRGIGRAPQPAPAPRPASRQTVLDFLD